MNKEAFIKSFLEGVDMTGVTSKETLIQNLLGVVYDARKKNESHLEHIEYMDEIARENDWEMTCRSCQQSYSPDCELSEMSHEGNYCGKNQWCCP